jgi:hypothetical protein
MVDTAGITHEKKPAANLPAGGNSGFDIGSVGPRFPVFKLRQYRPSIAVEVKPKE